MQLKNMKLTSVFLLLTCILQAFSDEIDTTEAPLSCYVCENCEEEAQYAEKLQTCNEEFFPTTTVSAPGITEATTDPITAVPTEADMTTNPPTPTTIADISSTSYPTTVESTEAPTPTPPTAGPPEPMPTPSNPGTVAGPTDEESSVPRNIATNNKTSTFTSTGSTPIPHNFVPIDSSESTLILNGSVGGRSSRQLRAAMTSDVTFHCYRAVLKVKGKLVTNRGCSRVDTRESVCNQVQQMNNGTKVKKCFACSESLCNGSSALAVSAATLLVAVLAALLHRN